MTYFVMLNGGNCNPLPLLKGGSEDDFGSESVALFGTKDSATKAGESNVLGKSRGYEVFEWPYKDEPNS